MERRTGTRPQRILVVEDSDDIRQMWSTWLSIWGFQVDEARDGAEAVRMVRAKAPDLVLMDLWMPVLDGLGATAQLKSDPATAGIPVLATSAQMNPPGAEQARSVGCEAFLPKPIDPDELLREVRKAFSTLQQRS
jgi:CheY-like chemotaxis protein